MATEIPFFDLRREALELRAATIERVENVLERGWFVLGPEVAAFETDFAAWLGVEHVVGVGSGTDAISIALAALGVGAGDEVITVANTCAPTALGIAAAGARVRLVDCDPDTLMMSIDALDDALTERTRAVVPVHLYGSAADVEAILRIATRARATVVEDCAHAVGTRLNGVRAGTLADAAAFSFYPTKNLGAYGEAGCIATKDDATATTVRALRHEGQQERDVSKVLGRNARLDEIQAAILRAKLTYLEQRERRRRKIADFYTERFSAAGVRMPAKPTYLEDHAYHLFPVLCAERDRFRARLQERGIGTLVHYPIPVHLHPAFASLGHERGAFPAAERACDEVVSVPLYPQLTDAEVERVAAEVVAAY